jgi:CRISPR-associated endonuclease/helicase Cas3
MGPALQSDEFAEFFKLLHTVRPFPWQARLARHVFAHGWASAGDEPTVGQAIAGTGRTKVVTLDVPTGAGKTAVIDFAVFHLALQAERAVERSAPVRILFVVDRRLIVDEAYQRAKMIAQKLAAAMDRNDGSVLARVAHRLAKLGAEGLPLAVTKLRGGVPKEPDWVRTPSQPAVIVSTIDQVGSRMLFRGYGISDTMKPVHAGLLGADALLLLDEAHLSQPFIQTVRDARMFQDSGPWSDDQAPAPFHIVKLSATQSDEPLRVRDDDGSSGSLLRQDDYNDDMLGPRLNAPKEAELAKSNAGADDPAFDDDFADRAWKCSIVGSGIAEVVAIVVNRVGRARRIFELLVKRGAKPFYPAAIEQSTTEEELAEVALLIGRTRDLDRARVLETLLPRIKAGRNDGASPKQPPLFIVATQSIEAGADLDFDALVTEIAPLDSLRQRFGRLNRMGRSIKAQAVILAARDQTASRANDPIYGEALKETWSFLNRPNVCRTEGRGEEKKTLVDFGIVQSRAWLPEGADLLACIAPRADAPLLLPRDIDLWSRTSPVPAVDPEISLYLHGPDSGSGDVEIVWRDDLSDDLPKEDWIDRVRVCPPAAPETVSVPIGEAKRWLRGASKSDAQADIADVERNVESPDRGHQGQARKALRWRGPEDDRTELLSNGAVLPGDVIVVPAFRGGCDCWGWAPGSDAAVRDLGREANRVQRQRDILRLSRRSQEPGLNAERKADIGQQVPDMSDRELRARFEGHFVMESEGPIEVLRGADREPLALVRRLSRRAIENNNGLVPKDAAGSDATSEDDESLHSSGAVKLAVHCEGVARHAYAFAKELGLPPPLAHDLKLAALLHDGGKAHPAFQRLLYGGTELAAIGGAVLAKSARSPEPRLAYAEACKRAGLEPGARHEVASLAVAEQHPAFARAHDPELLLWLIGTHHGRGRPFFPAVEWPRGEPFEVAVGGELVRVAPSRSLAELTASWIDMGARLHKRYGPWGLARLEAILRLADHRQSEVDAKAAEGNPKVKANLPDDARKPEGAA